MAKYTGRGWFNQTGRHRQADDYAVYLNNPKIKKVVNPKYYVGD